MPRRTKKSGLIQVARTIGRLAARAEVGAKRAGQAARKARKQLKRAAQKARKRIR
ncbi:MAG TPA: hypothetical protein VNN18_12510 [Candidatus Xenobia bacterium]|nr:hypothetical protein [Candidatus Xenobia bacterium]